MDIKTQNQAEVSIVKLSGELDASNAVLVDHELVRLTQKKPKQIWIDGSEISYISSAGLGVFLSHLNNFKLLNINLLFFGLNAKIRNVFTILGLDELVRIVPNLESALDQYAQA
ncbi:STAS domain-containing protein [Adhaeribacter terreus]|uniref:Anti-sigma factor antagonist n=1 Tax=Adhaeribacter terreus TaxID=529703 RepID=A0ABW0EBJ4_9BACT